MVATRAFQAIALKAVDGRDLTTSYTSLGSALTSPVYILTFKNTTDVTVLISEDASTDHYELPPGSSETYDFRSNSGAGMGVKRTGLQFSVKIKNGADPTCGRIILQGQTL